MSVTPSKTRTIEYSAARRPPATVLSWGRKTPASVLDFTLDVRNWLADMADDTIASCSADFTTAGIAGDFAITVQPVAGPLLTVWLSGGTVCTLYAVQFSWSTAGGRSETVDIGLIVEPTGIAVVQGTPLAVGPPGIIAATGQLVLQNGTLSLNPARLPTTPPASGEWLDGDVVRVVTPGES